jgi:hypothetical protein
MLHEIVNKLPESELITAARILTALEKPVGPLQVLLANAPLDDEPDDDDLDGGLTDARSEVRSGQTISHEELVRRLGIDE